MSGKTRDDLFAEKQPSLSDAEAFRAAKDGQVALSFNIIPTADDDGKAVGVAIQLALADGTFPTFILDRYCASILHGMLDALEKANWQVQLGSPPRGELS